MTWRSPPPSYRPAPPPPPRGCSYLNAPYNGRLGSSTRGHGHTVSVHRNRGYKLHGHGHLRCADGVWSHSLPTSVDVNECEGSTHDCSSSARCVNIDGGFKCECNSGYDLFNNDGKACSKRCPAGCVHGSCQKTKGPSGSALPEYKCNCNSKWTGETCNAPVCSNNCESSGVCSAPNTCDCKGTQ